LIDQLLCLVRLDTPVCTGEKWSHGTHHNLQNYPSISMIGLSSYGSACLGFKPHEVGVHSLQSGAAMEMYLGEIPVYTIMLIGRWSSDAFLHYI
jgi:hypothetical protein